MADEITSTVTTSLNADLADEISRGSEFQGCLMESAEAGAQAAQGLAPVLSGKYRDGISAVWVGGDPPKARIVAKDYTSAWIEWGSIHNMVVAPLRRGVTAVGMKFKAIGKGG